MNMQISLRDQKKAFNKKKILELIPKSNGVVADLCVMANISRETYYQYLKNDVEFKCNVDRLMSDVFDKFNQKAIESIQQKRTFQKEKKPFLKYQRMSDFEREFIRKDIFDSFIHRLRRDLGRPRGSRVLDALLSHDDVFKLVTSNCHYCGSEPLNKYVHRGFIFMSNGIDRVDSSIGYIKENCVTCCKHCNWAKREQSLDEFLGWVEKISQYQEKINRLGDAMGVACE